MTETSTTVERLAFVQWGFTDPPPAGTFTGVITYRRPNGTRLCEREFFNGFTWGTCRYFNANDRFVGQELYGTPGYDLSGSNEISGGSRVHRALVDEGEFQRIEREFLENCERYNRITSEFACLGHNVQTGVDTRLRTDGKTIAVTEWAEEKAWGCWRYYDEEEKLVFQEYYGESPWYGRPIDTDVDPFTPIPRGSFLSLYKDKKEFEDCKIEFFATRVPVLFERIFHMNIVRSKLDFVNLLCNIDEIATQTARLSTGEIPDDLDKQINLIFFVLREHPTRWCTDNKFAAALQCIEMLQTQRQKPRKKKRRRKKRPRT